MAAICGLADCSKECYRYSKLRGCLVELKQKEHKELIAYAKAYFDDRRDRNAFVQFGERKQVKTHG